MRFAFLVMCLAFSVRADDKYATITETAVAALARSAQISPYYEYGGQILQAPDGKYSFSDPETTYEGDHVSFSQDPEDYKGKIVADYHTHPCLPYTHIVAQFSNGDLRSARAFNRPGYMLDMCSGDVHFWAPGDPTETSGSINGITVEVHKNAVGKIVGHVPVPGKPLEAKP